MDRCSPRAAPPRSLLASSGLALARLRRMCSRARRGASTRIDEAVERIARDTRFFRYLDKCGPQCSVVLGDARLSLEQRSVAHDVLVLDAFSSDGIPVHLLTIEALRTYESRLTPDGILVFHISNRHIRLRPVVARLARDAGMTVLSRIDPAQDLNRGYLGSQWVVMARDPRTLDKFAQDPRWRALEPDARRAWSDDFSNIWTELAAFSTDSSHFVLSHIAACLPPGAYFRMLLIGYFEGIDSERGHRLAVRRLARAAAVPGVRLGPTRPPDHSTMPLLAA